MKKRQLGCIIVAVLIAIATVSIIAGLCLIDDYQCPPPPRPTDVPEDALWRGGCDGGQWIYLVDDSIDFHFVVYNDYSGEVIIDGIFEPMPNNTISLDRDEWKNQTLYYMEDIDELLKIVIGDSLVTAELVCRFPAYGGYSWEIIEGNRQWEIEQKQQK